MHWFFRDYVDERGVNDIKAWLDALPPSRQKEVRGKLQRRLEILRLVPSLNDPEYTKKLRGCPGLFEIRIRGKVQVRPIAFYGPQDRDVTIVMIVEERGNNLPPNYCDKALRRKAAVEANWRRACAHEFS
jgi:hypothetical protein